MEDTFLVLLRVCGCRILNRDLLLVVESLRTIGGFDGEVASVVEGGELMVECGSGRVVVSLQGLRLPAAAPPDLELGLLQLFFLL